MNLATEHNEKLIRMETKLKNIPFIFPEHILIGYDGLHNMLPDNSYSRTIQKGKADFLYARMVQQ